MRTGAGSRPPTSRPAARSAGESSVQAGRGPEAAGAAASPPLPADGRAKRRKRVAAQLKDLQQCYLALRSSQQQQQQQMLLPSSCAPPAPQLPELDADQHPPPRHQDAALPVLLRGASQPALEPPPQQLGKSAAPLQPDSHGEQQQQHQDGRPAASSHPLSCPVTAAEGTAAAARAEASEAAGADLPAAAADTSMPAAPAPALVAKRRRPDPPEGPPLAPSGVEPHGLAEFSRMLSVFTHFGSLQVPASLSGPRGPAPPGAPRPAAAPLLHPAPFVAWQLPAHTRVLSRSRHGHSRRVVRRWRQRWSGGVKSIDPRGGAQVVAQVPRASARQSSAILSSIEFDRDAQLFATAGVSKRICVFNFANVVRHPPLPPLSLLARSVESGVWACHTSRITCSSATRAAATEKMGLMFTPRRLACTPSPTNWVVCPRG